ncbi:MAG: replication initiation protein [Microvirga sp.]|nr:replication initiation protein [Microvirga sp.]
MLASMLVGTGVTHDDLKVFEVLVSLAYADDGTMPEGRTGVEMTDVIRYLGNRCRREDIKAAFRRLKRTELTFTVPGSDRKSEGVPLVQGWHLVEGESDLIEYELPGPVRQAMAAQTKFAYLELAALPPMRSKYSLAVYRRLAAMTASMKWSPGGSNRLRVSYSVDEFADAIGFPRMACGRVHGGKLKKQVLERLEGDLSAVRNFSATMIMRRNAARGRPVEGVDFVLDLAVPDHRHERRIDFRRKLAPGERRIGGADCDRFRVGSAIWRKAYRAYRSHFQLHGARDFFDLWMVALDEALDGTPLTKEAYKRRFRGKRLLNCIAERGADQAAWSFISEEADSSDLAPDFAGGIDGYAERVEAADRRRRERVDWDDLATKKKARIAATMDSPSPIGRPPPVATSRRASPVPVPEERPAADKSTPTWVSDIQDASRVVKIDETTWVLKPVQPAARPAGMPVFDGGSVTTYEAAMREWMASQRRGQAADPLEDLTPRHPTPYDAIALR